MQIGRDKCFFHNKIPKSLSQNKTSLWDRSDDLKSVCDASVGNKNCNRIFWWILSRKIEEKISPEADIISAVDETFIPTVNAKIRE